MAETNNDYISRKDKGLEEESIFYSLLFNLERQYLIMYPQNPRYIKAVPPIRISPGKPYFLRLKNVDDSMVTSLQEQLAALQATFSACHNDGDDKLIFIVSKNGTKNHIYLGSISHNNIFVSNLRHFLEGNWPGIKLELCSVDKDGKLDQDSDSKNHIKIPMDSFSFATTLTGIPSHNSTINPRNYQMDCLLRSMGSDSHLTYIVIAEPISENKVKEIIHNLHKLKGLVSFLKKQVELNTTLSVKNSKQLEKLSSQTKTFESTYTDKNSFKLNTDIIKIVKTLGTAIAVPVPPVKFLIDVVDSLDIKAEGEIQREKAKTQKVTQISEKKKSESDEITQSSERTFKQTYIDPQAQALEKSIEKYIERFETACSLGCWNVGVYFLAESSEIVERSGKFLKGLLSSEKSVLEPIRIHNLDYVLRASSSVYGDDSQQKYGVLDMLNKFEQPSLALVNPENPEQQLDHLLGSAFEGLTTLLNTQELSLFINLPSNNYLQ